MASQHRRRLWLWHGSLLLNPLIVVAVLAAAVWLRGLSFDLRYQVLAVVSALMCILVFNGFGVNRSRWRAGSLVDTGSLFFAWVCTFALLLVAGYVTKSTDIYSRVALSSWFVITPVVMVGLRLVLWRYFDHLRAAGKGVRRAVIAPLTARGARLVQELRQQASLGIEVLGYFGEVALDVSAPIPLLGGLESLPQFVRQQRVEVVYLVLERQLLAPLPDLLQALEESAAEVFLIPDFLSLDLLNIRAQSLNGIPLLAVGAGVDEIGGLVKRVMDVTLASLALFCTAPLLLAAALAIKLDSPGPVLFRQRRYGLHGEEITVLKLRTMTAADDDRRSVRQATRNDCRVTRVGAWLRRSSLDELPQLLNVLCGSMSLVGPRPHAIAHNEFYRDKIRGYMLRHKVRPGMTGWAQVKGFRGETQTLGLMQRRLDYDLEYIRHWSPLLDAWIIARTVPALLFNRNVY